MYIKRLSKILVLSLVSLFFLSGFKEKFSEKNQTGSPKANKGNKTKVLPNLEAAAGEIEEEPLILETGPVSEDRKTFDIWYGQFEESIRNKNSHKDRLEALHQGLVKIEKDKERLQNLKFNEEIEIDFLIKPLKHMPKVSSFDVASCTDYKMKILSHFDPSAEDEVKDPSLKKALNVFKLICNN
jgi:hypothetical protein